MADAPKFCLERLREVLDLARRQGFQDIFYGQESETVDKFILWRHDVDVDLPAAKTVARLEADAEVHSTYFLMTRGMFYNLFSRDGRRTVEEIVGLGHRLGLHCCLDAQRAAQLAPETVEQEVRRDFALLDAFFGEGIFQRAVSFHNPPNSVLRKTFRWFLSTYEERFFGDIKYLSDSNASWREGPLENWLHGSSTSRFSILLHPVVWTYGGNSMPEVVERLCGARARALIRNLEEDDVRVR